MVTPYGFNPQALYRAVDNKREDLGLSWQQTAKEMWALSKVLNTENDAWRPIGPTTITNIREKGDTTCQHAVIMLRWLGRPPEDFIEIPRPATAGKALPSADARRRLRWDLRALYDALNDDRKKHNLTWQQVAKKLYCTPSQLTGLRTAKFATRMRLAMRICQALNRPAADFIYAARW